MKIAIKANPDRGKEIISLLKSLGGINEKNWEGDGERDTYYIDKDNKIQYYYAPTGYKVYTLEEFEKEFPFKVGDKVITINDIIGIIDEFKPEEDYPYCIRADDGIFYWHVAFTLKPYKEMKEERNITLTLDKAKEWYKKGGELKEVALQAYSEEELTKVDLPKTWEEFCKNYPIKEGESYAGDSSEIYTHYESNGERDSELDRNMCPTPKSAEAHLAMMQLEQLRNCWRQDWKPTKYNTGYCIIHYYNEYSVMNFSFISFLSFPTGEMAEEFLKCFKDLIEKAGDLI